MPPLLPSLAIFDLDYTLLDKDSEIMWLQFVYQERLGDEAYLKELEASLLAGEQEEPSIYEFQHLMLYPLTLHSWEELQNFRQRYLQGIPGVIRPWMMERVAWHRLEGHMVLMATSANCFIAEPVAEMLGFKNLICSQIEREGDSFTGKLDGIPAYQEGKAIHIQQWAVEHGLNLSGSWGYSDSHNDIPMLSIVEHPVAVRPNARLRAYALEKSWQILE